jgi:hypothetical protein
MKKVVKSIAKELLLVSGNEKENKELTDFAANTKASQLLLSLYYRSFVLQNLPLPKLSDVGFRVYSQTDEDGIILFLFSVIGTRNKIFVEIGTGDGVECNCANLAINYGWHGLFIDGDEEAIKRGRKYYASHSDTFLYPPNFVYVKVTRENVNDILRQAGLEKEIELLSIDIEEGISGYGIQLNV